MPKVPRDVSPERLVRFLRRHGWPVVRQGARHTVVAKGDLQVAIPRHGPLKTGTMAAILRQTGPWFAADLASL